jgi:RNA polymerase sigma-70 factor, ECF subfamily
MVSSDEDVVLEEFDEQREDDRAVAVRLQEGDVPTWDLLYAQVYPAMLSYAQRRLGIGEEARDAVSEALTRAVDGVDRLVDTGVAPKAWFFGILRHVVLDQQRRNYRQRKVRLAREIVDDEPIEGIVIAEEGIAMRAAFEQLADRDREVLELRVVAGLSAEEAASVLGMRPGAVRTAQSRALTRLRALLSDSERESA